MGGEFSSGGIFDRDSPVRPEDLATPRYDGVSNEPDKIDMVIDQDSVDDRPLAGRLELVRGLGASPVREIVPEKYRPTHPSAHQPRYLRP